MVSILYWPKNHSNSAHTKSYSDAMLFSNFCGVTCREQDQLEKERVLQITREINDPKNKDKHGFW